MLSRLREYAGSPVYARECRARGFRDRVVLVALLVFVGILYLLMGTLVFAAAVDPGLLGKMIFTTCLVFWPMELACRFLGVVLTADCFSSERTQHTLDTLVLCPAHRFTILGAKLLARLQPLRTPLLALLPGLLVFPALMGWLGVDVLHKVQNQAQAGTILTTTGLTLSLYLLVFWAIASLGISVTMGGAIGLFFSLSVRSSGLAIGAALGTTLLLSLAFCFVSYFVLLFGGLLGAAAVSVSTWLGVMLPIVLLIEELLTRGLPAALLFYWAGADFDRLAGD